MRLLSILCGLSFATVAGSLFACWTFFLPAEVVADSGQIPFGPVSWTVSGLALLGAVMAWRSRCEGWTALATGCGLFLLAQAAVLAGIGGVALPALSSLAAAGFALLPLMHTPSSYWRVAG